MIFECDIVHVCRRSRLGAWIEITDAIQLDEATQCRSRLGAWIEIWLPFLIENLGCRSRLGAWIEM